MKKILKLAVVLVVVGIFAFSSNPTITKVRTVTVIKGKELFNKGTTEMKDSDTNALKKSGEFLNPTE